MKSKMSDTSEQYFRSTTTKYKVLDISGSGSFGQVFNCLDINSGKPVAVKLQKDISSLEGRQEGYLLNALNKENTNKYNFIKCFEWFHHKRRVCIVFEMLQQSLRQFIKRNGDVPLPLSAIRPIVQQILMGLGKLKELGIIHSDLKPDNIMLVDMEKQPYKIKIIDFGSAGYTKNVQRNTYVQTRYYRAPEVIIGLPLWEAIDMWSLGCIAAELFLGHPLYPGASQYDQIRYIIACRGLPKNDILCKAGNRNEFFSCDVDGSWRLKSYEQYAGKSGEAVNGQRKYNFTPLNSLGTIPIRRPLEERDLAAERKDRTAFIELLKCMLDLDPHGRITPTVALLHPFLRLDHLKEYDDCAEVQESKRLIKMCYRSSSCDTACGSVSDSSPCPP